MRVSWSVWLYAKRWLVDHSVTRVWTRVRTPTTSETSVSFIKHFGSNFIRIWPRVLDMVEIVVPKMIAELLWWSHKLSGVASDLTTAKQEGVKFILLKCYGRFMIWSLLWHITIFLLGDDQGLSNQLLTRCTNQAFGIGTKRLDVAPPLFFEL